MECYICFRLSGLGWGIKVSESAFGYGVCFKGYVFVIGAEIVFRYAEKNVA